MEQYSVKPAAVETFRIGKYTDIILRKKFEEVEVSVSDTETNAAGTVWQCEEKQFRVKGSYTSEAVLADFDTWWSYTEENESDHKLTNGERLDALESGVSSLETQLENTQLALCDVYEQLVGVATEE